MSEYETPGAVAHDAGALADQAEELVNATSTAVSHGAAEARRRVQSAVGQLRDTLGRVKDKAVENAKAADRCVRENPYKTMGLAFGIGAIVGLLAARRR